MHCPLAITFRLPGFTDAECNRKERAEVEGPQGAERLAEKHLRSMTAS